jgi:hypothetical protein
MAFGGWLGGIMFDVTGQYTSAFYIGAGFGVMNFVVIWLLLTRIRRFGAPVLAAA